MKLRNKYQNRARNPKPRLKQTNKQTKPKTESRTSIKRRDEGKLDLITESKLTVQRPSPSGLKGQ